MGERQTRYVFLGSRPYSIGWFAGTELTHPMIPDGASGTSCTLCYGWCCDARHLGHDILPPPVLHGVKIQKGRPLVRQARHSR